MIFVVDKSTRGTFAYRAKPTGSPPPIQYPYFNRWFFPDDDPWDEMVMEIWEYDGYNPKTMGTRIVFEFERQKNAVVRYKALSPPPPPIDYVYVNDWFFGGNVWQKMGMTIRPNDAGGRPSE